MRLSRIYILVLFINFVLFSSSSRAQQSTKLTNNDSIHLNQKSFVSSSPPIAVNDTFILTTGCGNYSITGSIFLNDYDPDGDKFELLFIVTPKIGEFLITDIGEFSLTIPIGFTETIRLEYYISEISESSWNAGAEVIILIKSDHDCDNVCNEQDLDNDNDGILDIDEGNGKVDSDLDGISDNFDIDSDNDGITDNEEWQQEGHFIAPKQEDINKNGWDDAYDNLDNIGGTYYYPIDSNNDGEPDFMDTNSDDDEISDYIEAYDINLNGIPEVSKLFCDSDNDGLDDAFDIISCWTDVCNSIGSNSPLPDLNKNGIRDWRETENYTPEEEIELLPDLISIYPNPSKGVFNINIPNSRENKEINLKIFSSYGTILLDKTISSNKNTVDIRNYDSGIYFAQLHCGSFIHSVRLIIKH